MPAPLAVTALVATGVSAYGQYKASRSAAAVDTATANYNANVDRAQAAQIDANTLENILAWDNGSPCVLSFVKPNSGEARIMAKKGYQDLQGVPHLTYGKSRP